MPELDFYRGDDYYINVTVADAEGDPIDVTGWSFKSTLKLSYTNDDNAAPIRVDLDNVSGLEAEQGKVTIPFTNEQTFNLTPGIYLIDVQAEYGNSVSTIFSGQVEVKPDVTRRVG
jgi:hypothetical protein